MDRAKALCKDYHADFWHPPFSGDRVNKESEYYEVAKAVCFQCPLLEECAQEGKDEEYGMWGGWTPRERNKGVRKDPTMVLTPDHMAVLPEPTRTPLSIGYVRVDLKAVSARLRKAQRS